MDSYALLHATTAEFRERLGDAMGAVVAYDAALALTLTEPERRFPPSQTRRVPVIW